MSSHITALGHRQIYCWLYSYSVSFPVSRPSMILFTRCRHSKRPTGYRESRGIPSVKRQETNLTLISTFGVTRTLDVKLKKSQWMAVVTVTSHDRHGAANHRQLDNLLKSVFMVTRTHTKKLRISSPLWGEFIGNWWIPSQIASNSRHVSCHGVILIEPLCNGTAYIFMFVA